MLKRFRFGGQDSITNPNLNIIRLLKNHESESEYSGFGGKDSNPNPNIRYNTVSCFIAHYIDQLLVLELLSQVPRMGGAELHLPADGWLWILWKC